MGKNSKKSYVKLKEVKNRTTFILPPAPVDEEHFKAILVGPIQPLVEKMKALPSAHNYADTIIPPSRGINKYEKEEGDLIDYEELLAKIA